MKECSFVIEETCMSFKRRSFRVLNLILMKLNKDLHEIQHVTSSFYLVVLQGD